jgi:hypothetical protein
MTKHRTTVFLETDILQAIRKVAKDDERPMSYHYDKALRAYGPIKKLTDEPVKAVSIKPALDLDSGMFDQAWELYERKDIPAYVLSTPDKQYRKNFETYLNQECWNDEVITNGQQNQPGRTTEGRKLSPAERSRAAAEANRAARARDRGDLDNVAGNIRQLNGDPIRGCDAGVVGDVIEGDYTTAD